MATTSGRLLTMLSLLQARRDWPGSLLAERLGVSPRTVRRDVERLRDLGYLVDATKGPDGGYRLGAGTTMPPLLLDDEQAVALAIALSLASGTGAGIEEAATRALTTIRQVMPSRLRHRVDMLDFDQVERPSRRPRPQADRTVLEAISAAVGRREVLRFDYAGAAGEAAGNARSVEAHHLVAWGGRWYLVGWDLRRKDWRTFRADRISPRIPNGPRFARRELPGGDVAAYVAATFQGVAGWACHGEVILDLPAARVLPFLDDAIVEPVGPARCRVALGSWSWTALAAAFGRFDTDVEVVGPPELAAAFDTLARRYRRAATTLART